MSSPVDLATAARKQTQRALATTDSPLDTETAGTYLKFLLLETLAADGLTPARWRRETTGGLRQRLSSILIEWRQKPPSPFPAGAAALLAKSHLRQRLLDLTYEAFLSESMAPETCLLATPPEQKRLAHLLEGPYNHGLLFAAPLVTHELYPLIADALSRDIRRWGYPRFNLVGVRLDWLNAKGAAERLVCLDFARGYFCEFDLDAPLPLDSVHFLNLGRQEQQLHRKYSAALPSLQVNPIAAAANTDDKAATLACWRAQGLPVADWALLPAGKTTQATPLLQRWKQIVVKPNRGTEGRATAYLSAENGNDALFHQVQRCWQAGDSALVQPRRDNALYRDPTTGRCHSLALRFNVAFDGNRHRAESGCAQIGPDQHTPAARASGARFLALKHIRANLVRRDQPDRALALESPAWEALIQLTETASASLPGLHFVGLDLVLDIDGAGHCQPILLEANSRPAGLSRSHLLTDGVTRGVTQGLWDALEEQLQPAAATIGSAITTPSTP